MVDVEKRVKKKLTLNELIIWLWPKYFGKSKINT